MYPRKSEPKEDRRDFNVYYPLPLTPYPPLGYQTGPIPEDGCQCVSIDPAIKNFAIRIERRFPNGQVIPIYFEKVNFLPDQSEDGDKDESARINPEVIANMTNYFLTLLPSFIEARLVVIERQISKYPKMLRVFQHWLTLFLAHVHLFAHPCVITDVSAKLKTERLGAPKKMNPNETKQWDIAKALEILALRQDDVSAQIIRRHRGKTKTKADDLSDTVIQLEALILVWGGQTIVNPDSAYLTLTTSLPEPSVDVSNDGSIELVIEPISSEVEPISEGIESEPLELIIDQYDPEQLELEIISS